MNGEFFEDGWEEVFVDEKGDEEGWVEVEEVAGETGGGSSMAAV